MIQRNVARLAEQFYDVLIVGGGISGACIAWDAALRGLRVALLERDDFGAGTSANSLKTVHGGLRYLQDLNLGQVRKMVRERQALLRIAPHLLQPLPCVLPTYGDRLMRSRLLMGAALRLNDLLSIDRNRRLDTHTSIPSGRLLSRNDCLALLPGLDQTSVSGGALWYDAQMLNSERLLLSFVLSAVRRGAMVANYVTVTALMREGSRVNGVHVEDRLNGRSHKIRSRVVVNAAGPWVDEILRDTVELTSKAHFERTLALNLVTRQIMPHTAVGIDSRYDVVLPDGRREQRSRTLFIAPWRRYSLVGTLHMPYDGHPDDVTLNETTVTDFLAEVNRAYPGARLTRDDVYHVHSGFLPAEGNAADGRPVQLVRAEQVTDHMKTGGIEGLITAVGVKFTTARYLAEKTVDLVFRKLGRPSPPCQTQQVPIYGGEIATYTKFVDRARREIHGQLPEEILQHLLHTYGSAYGDVTRYIEGDRCWGETVAADTPVTRAEIVHAVRAEMAQKLSDVICRRTELGSAGPPHPDATRVCAEIMSRELGWTRQRTGREIDEFYAAYPAALSFGHR